MSMSNDVEWHAEVALMLRHWTNGEVLGLKLERSLWKTRDCEKRRSLGRIRGRVSTEAHRLFIFSFHILVICQLVY